MHSYTDGWEEGGGSGLPTFSLGQVTELNTESNTDSGILTLLYTSSSTINHLEGDRNHGYKLRWKREEEVQIDIYTDRRHTQKHASHPQSERVKGVRVSGTRSPLSGLGQPGRNKGKCESVIVSEEKRADLDWLELAARQENGAKSSIVDYRKAKRATCLEDFGSCQCSFPSSVYRVTFSYLPAQHHRAQQESRLEAAASGSMVLDSTHIAQRPKSIGSVWNVHKLGRRVCTKTEQLFQILPPSVSRSTDTLSKEYCCHCQCCAALVFV